MGLILEWSYSVFLEIIWKKENQKALNSQKTEFVLRLEH